MSSTPEDLSTAARIRTAAFGLFAEHGIRATTVRMVADAAGVSAGLVLHHFGSKHGLRTACDEWLLERLGRDKTATVQGDSAAVGEMTSQLAELSPFMDYIVAGLSEGGEGADRLFDRVCDMTDDIITEGTRAGTIREPADRVAWVTTLTALSCGASILGGQVARRLGGQKLLDPVVYTRYALASVELFTYGMFTDDRFMTTVINALGDAYPPPGSTTDPEAPRDTPQEDPS
ncbi:TetR/AcrR family transcriptional regulator [Tessaracoccus antarcticus]|nr:TetR/AcrR family transcriptional regulator [Tessaracoccus antarcticus]